MKKVLILFIAAVSIITAQTGKTIKITAPNPKSDVFMQGFYWNSTPGGIWFDSLATLAPGLASAGFSAIWIPPAAKGGGSLSMGYDIYDNYDFGDYNQKGSQKTRFGNKQELMNMVSAFKQVGITCLYDAILNHAGNGDIQDKYECGNDSGYVIFNPASGRFPKTARNFHPNSIHCDNNYPYHSKDFFEDYCQESAGTGDSLIAWGQYIINELGFDGFRLDAIKHIEPQFIARFSQAFAGKYMVGEHWSGTGDIIPYLNEVLSNGGNIAIFDFPLRYSLRDMCNNTSGSYDMNGLDNAGLINAGVSGYNVSTFVENHDVDRIGWDDSVDVGHDPIVSNKDMAYAYTMFSEGRPCVFFKDYFMYGLKGRIDTLMWIRQNFIYGGTTKRSGLNPWYSGTGSQSDLSKDIYVAKRNGGSGKPAVYIVMNDSPAEWRGVWVNSDYPNQKFRDYTGKGQDKIAQADGRVELWAPPRGYCIYVPDTTATLNNPPVMQEVPDQMAYTNSKFEYQLTCSDVNGDTLSYSLSGNPQWLGISETGLLHGTPVFADTAVSNVIIKVQDTHGAFATDTVKFTVKYNRAPVFEALSDTTIKATKRFERTSKAVDADGDTLHYSFKEAPAFLHMEELSGTITGTPAVTDTGFYHVKLLVTDLKGAYDSTAFNLTVRKNLDSIIATYGKPVMDGIINIGNNDWREAWRLTVDSDSDSYWNPHTVMNNELTGIFATWDSDSLYLGAKYIINDAYNTLMFYIHAGIPGGCTNFNSTSGFRGSYPKNFRFRPEDNINFFTAAWNQTAPSLFKIDSSTTYTVPANGVRGTGGWDSECAIAWNDIYGLGAGKVPPQVKLKFVAVVSGGYNWGGGDSSPDNPDIDGDQGPDSLINLVSIEPDKDGNGIPDPTIIITGVNDLKTAKIPSEFSLKQNYPNPFNPSTMIQYDLPVSGKVELKVFDILGKEIAVLVNEVKPAGSYSVRFNASNLTSGVYFYRMKTGNNVMIKKMLFIK